MEQFEFFIDKKITTWERYKYLVEANSFEEAVKIMKNEFEDEQLQDEQTDTHPSFIECERLYDADEYLTPEENNGNYTKELCTGTENEILTNKQ